MKHFAFRERFLSRVQLNNHSIQHGPINHSWSLDKHTTVSSTSSQLVAASADAPLIRASSKLLHWIASEYSILVEVHDALGDVPRKGQRNYVDYCQSDKWVQDDSSISQKRES